MIKTRESGLKTRQLPIFQNGNGGTADQVVEDLYLSFLLYLGTLFIRGFAFGVATKKWGYLLCIYALESLTYAAINESFEDNDDDGLNRPLHLFWYDC